MTGLFFSGVTYFWWNWLSYSFVHLQSNFNGSNNFGSMTMCSRKGLFELMSANHSARSGGIKLLGILSRFSLRRYDV